MYMSKYLKIILTLILFLFSLYYTNRIIEYFQNKDPIMQKIINIQDKYYQAPIDAIITKNTVIPETNGKKINIKKSYQKMKKLGSFNESLLVYETIIPKKSYIGHYDKVIIPKYQENNIVLVFDINNDKTLFNNINQILKENNITASILNGNFDITNTNFKYILSTTYNKNTDYCITFDLEVNKECQINKKYTILAKDTIIYNNFLNNTKKAINNHNQVIIYDFTINTINSLDTIIKFIKNNNFEFLIELIN